MPQDEVSIEELPPEEWERYKTLRLEALKEEPQAFWASYTESLAKPDTYWQSRLEKAAQAQESWLVFATEHGDLLGMMGAHLGEEPGTAQVLAVYVSKKARGRGISKKLMAAILERLASVSSLERAKLTVNKSQVAAVSLYKSFGFEITGEKEDEMGDGNSYQEYAMEKSLR